MADKARINHNTVIRFENEKHEPNETTRLVIKHALEVGGLAFIDADETAGEGVRLARAKGALSRDG